MHEAKTHLSRLIQRALKGEEIIIAKHNKALVRLQAVGAEQPTRQLGSARGQVKIMPDFAAPLTDFDGYQ